MRRTIVGTWFSRKLQNETLRLMLVFVLQALTARCNVQDMVQFVSLNFWI